MTGELRIPASALLRVAEHTGMFTYGPGRCPPPPELGIPQALIAGSFPPSGQAGQRQAKRIYVGGIEESMTEQYLLEFFNKTMHERGLVSEAEGPGDPIQGVQVHAEKQFAFLEFRSIEEAASALSLDNIMCDETPLRVRRPKDYSGLDPLQQFMGGGGGMSDSPNRLFIGGLPTQLEDSQVLELLKSFGELKSFNLVKESNAEGSKVRPSTGTLCLCLTLRALPLRNISIRKRPISLSRA